MTLAEECYPVVQYWTQCPLDATNILIHRVSHYLVKHPFTIMDFVENLQTLPSHSPFGLESTLDVGTLPIVGQWEKSILFDEAL